MLLENKTFDKCEGYINERNNSKKGKGKRLHLYYNFLIFWYRCPLFKLLTRSPLMTKMLTVSNKQEAVLILNDAQKVKSFNITLDTEKDDETNKKQQQEA